MTSFQFQVSSFQFQTLASVCNIGGCGLMPLILVAALAWGGFNLWQALGRQTFKGARILRALLPVAAAILAFAWLYGNATRESTEHMAFTPTVTQADQPRMVFLGAARCAPCRMMAPTRETLLTEYETVMTVEYHDVNATPAAGRYYGINAIPTTIFFDARGRELYRLTGYMSLEDILSKWQELGIEISPQQKETEE